MRFARYLREEKYITSQDAGGILKRWEYGRRLLVDGKATTPAGNFKNGVLATLVGNAAAGGYKLSEREIQRRMQCGKTYPTEAQLRHAVAEFETWHDLAAANFPPVEVPNDGEPHDPRDADEKWRDFRNEQERREQENPEQAGLWELPADFSHDTFGPRTPLRTLKAACDESERYTENMAKRDGERRVYITELEKAAGGNLDMTWYEAEGRRLGLDRLGLTSYQEFDEIVRDFFAHDDGEPEPDDE